MGPGEGRMFSLDKVTHPEIAFGEVRTDITVQAQLELSIPEWSYG